MKLRALLRDLCPPLVWRWLARLRGGRMIYRAGYADWSAAVAGSGGYADPFILARIEQATDTVVNGGAPAERDGVLLPSRPMPFHLAAPMLSVAVRRGGRLRVLDFGGSLGTQFRLCRPLLEGVVSLDWVVVEQPDFVRVGRARFEGDGLRFAASIEAAIANGEPDVILLCSVVQFLPPDHPLFGYLARSAATYLVVERTPFRNAGDDAIYVQQVPAAIYPARYPMRALSHRRWLNETLSDWQLLHEESSSEGVAEASDGSTFDYRYQLLRSKRC